MPPLAGYWHSLLAKHGHVWRAAYKEATQVVKAKLTGRTPAQVEYAYARVPVKQSLHPVARLRQSQSRWFSTKRHIDAAARYFSSGSAGPKSGKLRNSYNSATYSAVRASPGRAPFASTLRPNLTGGALGRTAGGYGLGGGRAGAQRYFTHGPAVQSHVVQNVSQAVRAFLVGGQKAQFNGVDPVTGNKRFRACTVLQAEAGRKMRSIPKTTPGSHVTFSINPTITALTSMRNVPGYSMSDDQHLNANGLLDVLSTDFSRTLKELAVVLADLKRLSALGDMPITYEDSCLKIHFPGCDSDTVERLCDELNIQRGVVMQDDDFDAFVGTEMALLFPFAPSDQVSEADELFHDVPVQHKQNVQQIDWRNMLTPSESIEECSTRSDIGLELIEDEEPWLSSSDEQDYDFGDTVRSSSHSPLEYQGIEGIYRFIEQCDNVTRR